MSWSRSTSSVVTGRVCDVDRVPFIWGFTVFDIEVRVRICFKGIGRKWHQLADIEHLLGCYQTVGNIL